MGRLTVDMFLTLDGVVQAPGAPEEDPADGFRHGGWQAPFMDEESGEAITHHIAKMDALLLGRKTYDIFAAYWPKQSNDMAIAKKLNAAPKYVASRTLKTLAWQNSRLIDGDLAAAVTALKKKHGEVRTIGSAGLVQSLLQHDLVDRFNLWVYPLVLGEGKRLFGTGTVPTGLRLVESKSYPGGGVHLVYDKAGKPRYGDMTAS